METTETNETPLPHLNRTVTKHIIVSISALVLGVICYVAGALLPRLFSPTYVGILLSILLFLGLLGLVNLVIILLGPIERNICHEKRDTDTGTAPAQTQSQTDASSPSSEDGGLKNIPASPIPILSLANTVTKMHTSYVRNTLNTIHILQLAEFTKLKLTEREKNVAQLILEEGTYDDIARRMYLSASTIKFHAKNIYAKANVHTRRDFKKLIQHNIGTPLLPTEPSE